VWPKKVSFHHPKCVNGFLFLKNGSESLQTNLKKTAYQIFYVIFSVDFTRYPINNLEKYEIRSTP
jgi:hypothetical protein